MNWSLKKLRVQFIDIFRNSLLIDFFDSISFVANHTKKPTY